MRSAAKYAVRRRADVRSFPAPTGGWIANRNLAVPNGPQTAPGAFLLENFFPTSRSAKIRRGSELYATLGDGSMPVTALFSYVVGETQQMFAANATTIYNITVIVTPTTTALGTDTGDSLVTDLGFGLLIDSTAGLEVIADQSGGSWITVQFATSGGVYLVLVNGANDMLIYDGSSWYPIDDGNLNTIAYDGGSAAFTVGQVINGGTSGAHAVIKKVIGGIGSGTLWLGPITGGAFLNNEPLSDGLGGAALANGTSSLLFGAFTGIATSSLSYVWTYKNRLFFIEKDSLSAWYLPVENLTGAALEIPLGGVFNRGGSLLFGSSWALDSGSGGSGLSEQCVFVTTEGEVAVFQGDNPGDPNAWSLVNTYRIGKPLGNKAHIRAGGDLVIATNIGFVPLSQAIQRDFAALSPSAVSYSIEDAWNQAVLERGSTGWNCEVWPSTQMVIVATPTINDSSPQWFVANARTGAWAPFTNWDATCLLVFNERCFFGGPDGKVVEANVTGLDQGSTFTATYLPLFEDLKAPASLKVAKMARAIIRSGVPVRDQLSLQADFNLNLPSAPDASVVTNGSVWGSATWDTATWGEVGAVNTYQNWRDVVGVGYAVAPALQVTSGAVSPLDAEIIRFDLSYEMADEYS